MPEAACCLREEGEAEIADPAYGWHGAERGEVIEPVGFGEIGMAEQERFDEAWEPLVFHLAVAIHLDKNLGIGFERGAESGDDRPPDSLVLFVANHAHAGVGDGAFNVFARMFRAGIINDKNVIRNQERLLHNLDDKAAHPVARDDDRNILVWRRVALRRHFWNIRSRGGCENPL